MTTAPGTASLALIATTQATTGVVPLNEENVALLDQDLGVILAQAGFQASAGRSLLQTFSGCESPTPNCVKAIQAVASHLVGRTTTSSEGQATFTGLGPGTYFVFATVNGYGPKPAIWNLRVELRPGQNQVSLSPANAAP